MDEIIEAQANDDTLWEEAIHVIKSKTAPLFIPADLAARAAFLARLHRENGLEERLTRVIRERVEFEELAFAEVKRALAAKNKILK
jgi:hypothetical protein